MTFLTRMSRHPRGSGLLLVVILLLVLMLIATAVVTSASNEVEAVSAKRRYDKSVSCSEAARNLVLSQFRTAGTSPDAIVVNSVVDDRLLKTGHYDSAAIASVVPAAGGSAAAPLGLSDISNRVITRQLGGQLYRVTVVCSKSSAAAAATLPEQNEIEYLVRFGL